MSNDEGLFWRGNRTTLLFLKVLVCSNTFLAGEVESKEGWMIGEWFVYHCQAVLLGIEASNHIA